jgi:cation:H+ antiporter
MFHSTGSAAVAFPVGAVCSLGASFVLVTRLERLAGRVRLSEAMLGLVVALAADSPEITSAVTASAHGQTGIGAGVVLGSNVFNLAALLGLGAIVARRIRLHRKVVILDGAAATWVGLVTVIVVSAGLPAGLGVALVLLVVVPYVVISASSAATLRRLGLPAGAVTWLHRAVQEEELEFAAAIRPVAAGRWDVALASGSLVVVVAASTIMERSSETLGKHFHLSTLVVGGLVLAAVTSLPNAVGAVFLASRGRGAAVLSEAMNSNMLNVLVGLFLPGIFIGLGGATTQGALVASWYAGLTVISLLLAFAGRGLDRRAGSVIVAGYAIFVAIAVTA